MIALFRRVKEKLEGWLPSLSRALVLSPLYKAYEQAVVTSCYSLMVRTWNGLEY